jgi:hypothetical protein
MPTPPRSIIYQAISPTAMHISWKKAENADSVQLYAVYYRPIESETYNLVLSCYFNNFLSIFKVKTMSDSVVLDGLEPGRTYRIAVTAANMFGFSQYATINANMPLIFESKGIRYLTYIIEYSVV